MMAGFGESKPERPKPKVVGAGRGQKVYRQQVKSFVGLRKAGAEFVDVYATEAESKDNRFIFAGKVAWSSGITVEQALQVWVNPVCQSRSGPVRHIPTTSLSFEYTRDTL